MGNNTLDWDDTGALLGIFFGISTLLTVVFMDRVQGKTYRIQDYLASRHWHLFKDEDAIRRVNFVLKISCWIFFGIPPITLIFWGSGLIARYSEFNRNVTGGIGVFLLGFAALFFLFGAFKIKWNRYRMSRYSGFSLLASLCLLTAYQIVVTFIEENDHFFGISSIFLTANAVVMIIIVFMNTADRGTHVGTIVKALPEGDKLDISRASTYDDEITEAWKDDDYVPTQNEIFEMFTINQASQKRGLVGVFEGGLLKIFNHMSPKLRRMITVMLYIIAIAILGKYF
jgi:hypothetical protein